MNRNLVLNPFLSPERNETLNSLKFLEVANSDCAKSDLFLNYPSISSYLNNFYDRTNPDSTQSFLSKLMSEYNRTLDTLFYHDIEFVKSNLLWLSTDLDVMDIIRLLYTDDDSDSLICLLQLTSIAENSLANIYVQKGINCPNMLTCLLNTEIIKDEISPDMVNMLSLLIGSPSSLNLRNLSWHGYLWDTDISVLSQYAKFLLVCLWNIGAVIANHDTGLSFTTRLKITPLPDFVSNSGTIGSMPQILHFEKLDISFPLLLPKLQAIEVKIFAKAYYQSLCLSLPLLEFYMRMLYIRVNDLSINHSIAVCNELFVTEDIVLTKFIGSTDVPNNFKDVVGEGFCNVLIETFIYPGGPRIKDIISHGEVTLFKQDLSSWAILLQNMLYYVIGIYGRNLDDENLMSMSYWLHDYQLTTHSYSLVKKDILIIEDIISQLEVEVTRDDCDKNSTNMHSFICDYRLTILFREDEVVSECGITLRVIANQLQLIQGRVKSATAYILEFLKNEHLNDRKLYNRNSLLDEMPYLISYFRDLNGICCKIYIRWIVRCDSEWQLMNKLFVRLIKNMVMSADKVNSIAKKHQWTDVVRVTDQFYEVLRLTNF